MAFIKVQTSPHYPMGNSVIDCIYPFQKASIGKLICNPNTAWDELAHMAMMVYNFFHILQQVKLYFI